MSVKKGNTYYQDRRKERLDPILLKVLKVIDPDCSGHEICKVRWHILGKDKVYTSVFPMATIRIGEFADFKPMPRELFCECVEILKNAGEYKNAKRRVLYRTSKLLSFILLYSLLFFSCQQKYNISGNNHKYCQNCCTKKADALASALRLTF